METPRSGAIESLDTPKKATPVTPSIAKDLLESGHRYLDVRTPENFAANHVEGAINIPYYFPDTQVKNPKFEEEVAKVFGKDDPMIVACQTGNRSTKASNDLAAANFTKVNNMVGGLKAWAASGFPVVT